MEPLAGEAEQRGRAGRGADAAEGEIAGGPDPGPDRVGCKHRPPDVVGADEIHRPALDHGDRLALKPDILADQRAGGDVAEAID